MKIRRFDIMIYLEMLLIFLILRQNGFLKYIIFLFWILYKALKNKRFHLNSLGYLLLPSLVCVILGGIISIFHKPNFETFREICFVIIPTFGAYVLGSIYDEKKIKKYIYASFQAIVTLFIIFGIGTFTVENLMESTYAFIFGIYVLYFLCCKNYKYMFLSIICMILADKRIVWGAVVVGSIVLVVLSKKKWERNNNLKRAQRIVGAVGMLSTVLMLLFVFMCRYGIIAKIMYSLNINSMGRLDVWNYFSKYYNFHIGYTGIGLGGVKQILNLLGNKHFDRLHNDILLYYIELGFGGFFIFIFSHFQMINHFIRERIITYKNAMDIIVLIVYTLVCYCTDNISIYIHYIFPLYLIMCDFLKKERKPGRLKMKFSIITISFNAASTIENTIKSVYNQDFSDFEYILVDGGSTDGTVNIIKKYQELFKKRNIQYRFISESDSGISDAFNKGIKMAVGEYVGIINAGDELCNDILSKINCLIEPSADIVYGNVRWVDIDRNYTYVRKSKASKLKYLKYDMVIMHPSVFVKREVYEKCGTFDLNYKYCMDQELLARFLYKEKKNFMYIDTEIAKMISGGVSDSRVWEVLSEARKITESYTGNFIFAWGVQIYKYIKNRMSVIYKNMMILRRR